MTGFEESLKRNAQSTVGETITYKELARRCGRLKLSGGSEYLKKTLDGAYPVPSCRRFRRKLGGYSGGIARKKELIKLEQQIKDMIK